MSNIVYRSYYALNSNKFVVNNESVNAIYGTIRTLLSLPKLFGDNVHVVACQDSKRENLQRTKTCEGYKANRPKAPDELYKQFRTISEMLPQLSVTCVKKKGFEADDVIATLVQSHHKDYEKIVILSSDKDLLQLLYVPNVVIYDFSKKQFKDAKFVQDKYGCTPEQFILYQSLIGDACDNVKGVPRVGPKTAIKILNDPSSHIWEKYKDTIANNKVLVELNKYIDLGKYTLEQFETNNFENIIEKYQFKSLMHK